MKNVSKIFSDNGLNIGRMVSYSKSVYKEKYPNNMVIFNANIMTLNKGVIWYGDLDITESECILNNISKELGESLFVLRESDAFYINENTDFSKLKSKSVWESKLI